MYRNPYTFTHEPGLGWAVEWLGDEVIARNEPLHEAIFMALVHATRLGKPVTLADFECCSTTAALTRFERNYKAGQVRFTTADIVALCRGN